MDNHEIYTIANIAVNSSGTEGMDREDGISVLISMASICFAHMCKEGETERALMALARIAENVTAYHNGTYKPCMT